MSTTPTTAGSPAPHCKHLMTGIMVSLPDQELLYKSTHYISSLVVQIEAAQGVEWIPFSDYFL